MKELFYKFEIGDEENPKIVQIEAISAGETLDLFLKAYSIWNKGGNMSELLENTLLKGFKINNKDAIASELELYEYIDALYEAVSYQLDFESLGKSRVLKRMGINISGAKEKFNDMIMTSMDKKQEEN